MELYEIGNYIKTLRKAKGMTLIDLETRSGVSNSYLSQIENGKFKPSTDILVKLAGPLGESPLNLMEMAGYYTGPTIEITEDGTISGKAHDEELKPIGFMKLAVDGKVLKGEEAYKYLDSIVGSLPKTEEEANEDLDELMKLELSTMLTKDLTFYGNLLNVDERKRVYSMLEILFPQYIPKDQ
ncbi:hypothetical protein PMSD_20620 [Paenibacillus macquariensis subsp. defensor]|nr:hypothetical protein PMSD_20620 [Paenibacillus macquariensis subsp. defensor]